MITYFAIIGAQKCGTSTVSYHLNKHPQVDLIYEKKGVTEHGFFGCNKYFNGTVLTRRGKRRYNRNFKSSSKHFIGHKKPSLMLKKKFIKRLIAAQPDVKIIIILRDPVDRFESQMRMTRMNFQKAWKDRSQYNPLIRGKYAQQLENNVFSVVPRKNILLLFFEEMVRDMQSSMNNIFSFIGLPPHVISQEVRITPVRITINHPRIKLTKEQRKKLIEYYKEHNNCLERLLGRSLEWRK